MTEILRADRISKTFGSLIALSDVSLGIETGEIRAVCGENGAGKSTLVKILMGVHRPDGGAVFVGGAAMAQPTPKAAQRLGLAMVAQELSLAPHLSVLDNIWLGHARAPFFRQGAAERRTALAALERVGAADIGLDRPAGALTIGERQLVEIARLMARDARVLILDEPTASLSDIEIARIFTALRALKAEGRSALYITHRLGEVFEICDSVTVLRNGEHVASLAVRDIDRAGLIELMLGRGLKDMYPAIPDAAGETAAFAVERLSIPGAVAGLGFVAPRGKIFCIAGQLGSGAQQAVRALAGLVPEAEALVRIDGKPFRLGSARRALARNILFVSEDRASEGLFLRRSVLENLVATRLSWHRRLGFLSWRALRAAAAKLGAQVGFERARLRAMAAELSGGNQQKLLFARGLDRPGAGVLLMNEPTRGVDVGSRAEIYRLMREFCGRGYALVMTSSDLEEVVGIADIVLTMYRGRAIRRYQGHEIAMPAILSDITNPANAAAGAA